MTAHARYLAQTELWLLSLRDGRRSEGLGAGSCYC